MKRWSIPLDSCYSFVGGDLEAFRLWWWDTVGMGCPPWLIPFVEWVQGGHIHTQLRGYCIPPFSGGPAGPSRDLHLCGHPVSVSLVCIRRPEGWLVRIRPTMLAPGAIGSSNWKAATNFTKNCVRMCVCTNISRSLYIVMCNPKGTGWCWCSALKLSTISRAQHCGQYRFIDWLIYSSSLMHFYKIRR